MEARKAEAVAVELSGARFSFGELDVLAGIDCRADPGEVVALVGPSGCGKSTLLELICGLREPGDGTVEVAGAQDGRLAQVVLMPQRDSLLAWLSAEDNAGIGLRNHGVSRSEARSEAAPMLRRFGLAGFEQTPPFELSGGMRQRVAFARTLLVGKPVLALDEPFASLDAFTRAGMQEWLAEALTMAKRTTVLVSHDTEEALYLADRVVVLSARPARVMREIASPVPRLRPRTQAVTDPEFIRARAEAMEALEEAAHAS